MEKFLVYFTTIFLFVLNANALTVKNITGYAEYHSELLQSDSKDANEEWESDQLQSININTGFDLKVSKHELQVNSIIRHYQSAAFEADVSPAQFVVVPYKIIGRDFFKSRHQKIEENEITEATFNKFAYSWEDADMKLNVGRIPIVFGHGHSLNPINPFNYNGQLSIYTTSAQGNDGAEIILTKDSKLKLHIYLLADKSFTEYDERITKTVMLRGEWNIDQTTEVNYILGEDQHRHKYGAEVAKGFSFGQTYAQFVRYSQRLDKDDASSKGLFHYLGGIHSPLSPSWKLRLELGKYERDEDDSESFNANYLPFEYFSSLQNEIQINDEVLATLDYTADSDSSASFLKISVAYVDKRGFSIKAYSSGLSSDPKEENIFAEQELIPTNFGLAIKYNY